MLFKYSLARNKKKINSFKSIDNPLTAEESTQWLFVRHPYRDFYFLLVGSQRISLNFSVIADSSLSKLFYLPLGKISDSNECRFFEPD